MKDNKAFLKQRKPTQETMEALAYLYQKNPNLKKLINTFDLDIRGATLEPLNTSDKVQANDRKTIVREIIKQNNTMAKKDKFQNEIEESTMEKFVKFEKDGDKIEGFVTGRTKEIKNKEGQKSNCFVINVEGEEMLLPATVTLNRKLENLCKIHEAQIKAGTGVETQITYTGLISVEGVEKQMKSFKVLTA